ncbi:hypothetical protein E2C01_088557 [Portunus trituberculatus]|uniref:Uncharacterized protein n=1 Tax=Portunus trituberculatus TaxID=210409 RepID=A0A5B7J6I5_PORTR|nr:hypothetical protein [Portunus trituberculatus]
MIDLVRASPPSSLKPHNARGTCSRSSTRSVLLGHSARCLNESGAGRRWDRMAVVAVVLWRKHQCGCGLVAVGGDAKVKMKPRSRYQGGLVRWCSSSSGGGCGIEAIVTARRGEAKRIEEERRGKNEGRDEGEGLEEERRTGRATSAQPLRLGRFTVSGT